MSLPDPRHTHSYQHPEAPNTVAHQQTHRAGPQSVMLRTYHPHAGCGWDSTGINGGFPKLILPLPQILPSAGQGLRVGGTGHLEPCWGWQARGVLGHGSQARLRNWITEVPDPEPVTVSVSLTAVDVSFHGASITVGVILCDCPCY